jgi:hypothetical protein
VSALKVLAPLGPLIAAVIVGTDRKIIAHLRSAGAITPDRATPILLSRPLVGWRTSRLLAGGALGSPSPDRYFLIEDGWQAYGRIRRRRALTVVAIAAALGALFLVSQLLF